MRHILCLAIILTIPAHLRADDRTFVIKFDRPEVEGRRQIVEDVFGVNQRAETTWQGDDTPVITEKAWAYHLLGELQTLQTDGLGHELLESFIVHDCKRVADDVETTLLKRGSRIVVRPTKGDEPPNYRIDGELPTKEVLEMLRSIYNISPPQQANDPDIIFGSTTPRKVGETWPINSKHAATTFNRRGTNLTAEDFSGTVTIMGVETYNGIECIRVESDVETKEYTPALPKNATTRPSRYTATLKIHRTWLLPVDPQLPIARRMIASSGKYIDEGMSDGRTYKREMTYDQQGDFRLLPNATDRK